MNTQTGEQVNISVKALRRAVVYARASQSAEQGAQISKCRNFMAANGYTEQGIISEAGSGTGVGGRLRRILAETVMLRANGPVALIAESESRLGRDAEDVALLICELKEAGVRIVVVQRRELP